MHILPINIKFNNTLQVQSQTKREHRTDNTNVDTLSFTGGAPNAEALRALYPFKIPDLYSPITILEPSKANVIYNSHVFSGSIKAIVDAINPIRKSLFPVEESFFQLVKAKAKINPDMHLNSVITELIPYHQERLRDAQLPIFADLEDFALDLPGDLLQKFNYLMYVSDKKINNESIFIPFSIKEFKYKLNRIRSRILDSYNTDDERKSIDTLVSIAGTVPEISKEIRLSPKFKLMKYEDKQKSMINKFAAYFESSSLKNDKSLRELVENAEQRIYKVPIRVHFNRKSFIYDLQEITDKLEDKRLARLMNKTAISLPTSKENLSAFIMKAAARSEDQIAYDMISGSVGTIDHLIAAHRGGKDSISNYAISSAYKNSQKAHKTFAECYRHDTNIEIYAQTQINRLISLANRGIFKKIGLDKGYIDHLANKLEELSKTPSFYLDTNRLQY